MVLSSLLVLTSLFIQYILHFSYWVRLAPVLRRFRVLVWMAYVSSDAVAIFALATVFNRHMHTCDAKSSNLEVLWVPVLIIHLGDQPWISAYSLEDNELWKRHAVTLVSQVTVAFYVFCRWWSGEKRLLASAVLLFVVGFLRFAQKPWALRTASFNSFQASSTVPVPRAQREEEPLHEYIYTLEEYVQAAKKCALGTKVERKNEYEITSNYMFVDRSAPYSVRIEGLTSFLKLEYKYAYKTLKCCLGDTFRSLYTRIESIVTIPGVCSVLLLPFLALASMVLFATSSKNGQNKNDIRVTYILFCCTTVLELLLPSMTVPCCHSLFFEHLPCGWHDMVSQHNIMSFCVRKKNPTFMMKLVTFNFLRELVNQHRYVQQVPIAYQITGTVRRHIEDGWKKYIHDAASYRRFSELRGQWALRMHHQLGWSLNMAFDESVLIWHVATELCFYHPNTSSQCRQGEATQHGREISNYMFYLLLIRPEMLMPGTRSDLFTMVSDKIVENSNGPLELTEEILAQEILNMSMLPFAIDMVSKAHKLAGSLMELGGEEERWTVVQGVWVEMLCYSANRCRGYLHAKTLGDAGECLTIIWLLLTVMGMETFADRHHRSEPRQQEQEEQEEAFPIPKEKKKRKKKHTLPSCSQGRDSQSADGYRPPV